MDAPHPTRVESQAARPQEWMSTQSSEPGSPVFVRCNLRLRNFQMVYFVVGAGAQGLSTLVHLGETRS